MLLQKEQLSHGMPVRCVIRGIVIENAKISFNGNGVYICQDIHDVYKLDNKLGYKYAFMYYCFYTSMYDPEVSMLEEKKLRTIKDGLIQGDIIFNKVTEDERKVLGICGEVIFVSADNKNDVALFPYTLSELIKGKWELKQNE